MEQIKNSIKTVEAAVESAFENGKVIVYIDGDLRSSVLLHIAHDYAASKGLLNKLSFYYVDHEAQFSATTKLLEETLKETSDIEGKGFCVPHTCETSVKLEGDKWIAWDEKDEAIWCRKVPKGKKVVTSANCPFKVEKKDTLKQLREKIEASLGGKVLDSDAISDVSLDVVYSYCIENKKKYNSLYDLFLEAGMPFEEMSVVDPFVSKEKDALVLFRAVEQDKWCLQAGRVMGLDLTKVYGGKQSGWKTLEKPARYTWKEVFEHLTEILGEDISKNYNKKIKSSIGFWSLGGGSLPNDVVTELKAQGIKFAVTSDYGTKSKVTFAEYPDGVEGDIVKAVPSYKRACICALKNDFCCQYMGFSEGVAERNHADEWLRGYRSYKFKKVRQ